MDGFAYGVIGADLHVLPDRGPVYLLHRHRPASRTSDPAWLMLQPSRLLDARHTVVGFTGRQRELDELCGWRDGASTRISACWLHAPGGQGKTRLAEEFARLSGEAGWRVVTATQGLGIVHPRPGSQDLRPDGSSGVLLVVDYADRWPVSHLTWLFSNALLHHEIPTRVLLIARSAHGWPAVRAALAAVGAELGDRHLAPLPDDPAARHHMFRAARDAFAERYGVDPDGVPYPDRLDGSDFGLTLALHMAALVAVDAVVSDARPPEDLAGLSAYLLDRELAHWRAMYEKRVEGMDFATSPTELARTVFTATLTGPVSHSDGVTAVIALAASEHPQRALADHAICYPSADPGRGEVLEPLYPDRIAEDFLALTLPGHDLTAYPSDPWCVEAPARLLAAQPRHTPRAVTFLTAAAARWPHLARRHLYPLLRSDPTLGVRAGNAALSALAQLPDVPVDVLTAVMERFPEGRDIDLDSGIASVTERLIAYRLAETDDPAQTAELRNLLARRLAYAGRDDEAVTAARKAVEDCRRLPRTVPDSVIPLAVSLTNLASHLGHSNLPSPEAVERAEEAVILLERLVTVRPGTLLKELTTARAVLSVAYQAMGRHDSNVRALSKQTISAYRALAAIDSRQYEPYLMHALHNAAVHYREDGRIADALACSGEALEIAGRLSAAAPATHLPSRAQELFIHGNLLMESGRADLALPVATKAVEVIRRMQRSDVRAHEPDLARALDLLGNCRQLVGQVDDAIEATEEAVRIGRRLVRRDARAHEWFLAMVLDNLGTRQAAHSMLRQEAGSPESMKHSAESATILRQLADETPERFDPELARVLSNLAVRQMENGRMDDALETMHEALALRERLVERNPAAHRFRQGWDLGNLAQILLESGAPANESAHAAERAVTIFREAARTNPREYELQLAKVLMFLACARAQLPDETDHARQHAAEAIEICRHHLPRLPGFVQPFLDEALALHRQLGGASGHGETAPVSVSLEQAAMRGVVSVTQPGTGREIRMRLPAGIRSGQRVRVDCLELTVTVRPHPTFRRDGDDLRLGIPVTWAERAAGLVLRVPLLEGGLVKVRLPPAAPVDRLLRIPGRGCLRADGTRGDMLISLDTTPGNVDASTLRDSLLAPDSSGGSTE
ncbi:DnaJ C-terminal domain-containing protein [Embleya hyalina]|uniref:Molecular chaperone Tir n=1 Tax=Embleya hyalina TaxID=516124 RepID=A0A401YX17_9ACTN|nr:DnaJ C-terminal domain-containing protein [Embleya hyalina]GCD99139.1 molecular chaperone Tir [Embleya hyalina]